MADLTYRYAMPSSLDANALTLATAGGRQPNPVLFDGFAEDAQLVARALLTVAEVARTRYFDPGAAARSLDPVVTSNLSVLRFESFSGCNGVYARFDIDDAGLDGTFHDWGTTNVDVNQPMRTALAQVAKGEPLKITVGTDELAVQTLDATAVEKQVPLPDRWVRGFAEVSVVLSGMELQHDFPAAPARRILRDVARLPKARPGFVTFSGNTVRMTSRPGDEDIAIAGSERLGSLGRLIPMVTGLRIYAPPPQQRLGIGGRASDKRATAPAAWEVRFDGARLVLALSPEPYRGFSGEGQVLRALAQASIADLDAAAVRLEGQAAITSDDIPTTALDALGAAGRVGFDLHRTAHFHRDLPFDRSAADGLQPRLENARALIDAGEVTVQEDKAEVRGDTTTHTVRFTDEGLRCTCPWFAKHRGERGPCKHALAAEIARTGWR